MRGGYYRPAAYHKLTGTLDADGKIAAWKHDIVCQTFLAGTPFAAMIKNGVDETAVEGAKDLPYAIDNVRVNWHVAPAGVPTLWWRSVGHSHTAFVVEGFLDELIHAAGQDPLEVRRKLLADHPRHKRVVELAAEKARWGKPLPAGHGMGLAVHESFGSFAAHVVEASASPEGVVRVHRVVAAIDCGPIVNPDTIKAQLEGGVAFGLSAASNSRTSTTIRCCG
jgi:isoquinoline 1-oxidoreductase beta subunit